jgi:hypothetical protein
MNNYPVPGHTGDHRLTLDLVNEVRGVLVRHGYPELTYDDLNLLRAMLARFIYPPKTAADHQAGGGAGTVEGAEPSGHRASGAVEGEGRGPSGVTRVAGLEPDARRRVRRKRAVVRGVAGGHHPTVR